ncbi:Hypothetical predicted protein [Paramuricea clavata]|uniref:Uncharacterized protein n=1 Tax=Paramuricea clavata TaxID=317549 RepID=A0A6S7H389_PARCT|nr:Hypothetical predicted protein [Paramuricea clavata]
MKTTRALCGKNFMEKSPTNPFGLSLILAIKYESAKQGTHLRKDTYLIGPRKCLQQPNIFFDNHPCTRLLIMMMKNWKGHFMNKSFKE